ncbi:MAG: hypothetical protein ILA34_05265 [Bacteroidaceae bacterium]|nr:hypothetical protein [Bacteroidaceae bacterium]
MKKIFALALVSTLLLGWGCSSDDHDRKDDINNVAITGNVKDIKIISAVIEGKFNGALAAGEDGIYTAGMEYSNTPDFEQFYRVRSTNSNPKSMSTKIMCVPQTTYYYRAYVNVNNQYYYGDVKSFTTKTFTNIAKTGEVQGTSYTHATVLMYVDENLQEDEFEGSVTSGRTYGASTGGEIYHDVAIFYSSNRRSLEKIAAGDTSESKNVKIYQRAIHSADYTSIKRENGQREFLVRFNDMDPETEFYYCAGTISYSKKVADIRPYTGIETRAYTGGEIHAVKTLSIDNLTLKTHDAENVSYIWGSIPWTASESILNDISAYATPRSGIIYSTSEEGIENHKGVVAYIEKTDQADSMVINLNPIEVGTTFYYRSFVRFGTKYLYGPINHFSTMNGGDVTPGEIIDLGLSIKWRNRNVGSATPEDPGYYFQWSRTDTTEFIERDDWWGEVTAPANISGTAYDPARKYINDSWRMPKINELEDLQKQCMWIKGERNGQAGYIVMGTNGNTIFMPFTGYMYSQGQIKETDKMYYFSGQSYYAISPFTLTDIFGGLTQVSRRYGCVIRPVTK